jgi:hypothetical protein
MAKLNELTINIGVTIPEDTMVRCVEILSMWLTDNPDKTLTVTEDGSNHMSERRRYLCIQDVKREKNE